MKTRSIKSREEHFNNHVGIILCVEGETDKKLDREIKKAVRKWSRIVGKKLSFRITILGREEAKLEEQK